MIAEGLGWTERFGNDAMVSWLRGRALRELGRTNGARAALRAAIELDPFPLRALGAFNDAVRAQDGEGVRVADVEKRLASYAPDGLVGFDLICDNCHPTPLGAALAAREVARTMASEGWLLAPDTRLGSARSWLERHERQLGGSKRRRRVRWLLSNGVYAMKTPFFHFPVARGYLERARDLDPRSWQAWANLATLSLLEGDLAGGRRELQRATALKGSPLDPADRGRVPYLAEALRRASAAGGS